MSGVRAHFRRRSSEEGGAWWSSKTAPPLQRHSSADQYSHVDHPETIPHPSNRRRSLDNQAAPPARGPTSESSHLHYRDTQWASAHDALNAEMEKGEKGKLQEEEDALARALEASRRDNDDKAKTTEKEDQDLRRALAESARLARSNPSLAEKEQAELSQALLASQRQLLIDSRPSKPPRASQRPSESMSRSSSSSSLEESEWALRARNEKGSLWREAGAHGWLPPGASRAVTEEEREMKELELAIRISLQEEEERRKRDEELARTTRPPLYGQGSGSTRYSSYATAPSDFSMSSAPEIQNSAPTRKLPPPPPQIITTPLSPPTSPLITSPHQDQAPPLPPNPYSSPIHTQQQPPPLPSRAPPTPPQLAFQPSPDPSAANLEPPRVWTEDELSRSGSPYEMPYLTSSPSMHRSGASWSTASPVIGQSEHSHETGTSGEWSAPSRSSGSGRSRVSTDAQQPHEEQAADPLEALTVRNPDSIVVAPHPPPTRGLPPPPPTVFTEELSPTDSTFPAIESTMAGRSLSLVSEATEPPSPGSAGSGPAPQLFGGDRRAHSPPVQSPTLEQTLQSGPPEAAEASQGTQGREDQEVEEAREEQRRQTSFGDGVRFGYPKACAHEQDHVCSLDGLGSDGPFPSEIVLGSGEEEEKSAFSVEARSWPGLLRFLMWYGETTLHASVADIAASPHRHCDAALSLSFRTDNIGSSILRLTFSILPPHEHGTSPDPELTIASSPAALASSAKGKGKARASAASSPSTTYMLPDHIALPSRLANSAHTLYSLRHLAQIALSTQPSKHASPSYHALRSLAQSIQQLASTQQQQQSNELGSEAGGTAPPKGDDLVGRLRDRLRRMRGNRVGSTSGGSNGAGSSSAAKLQKAPPLTVVERTQAVRRRERVLTADDEEDYEDSEDYQEARDQDEVRRREEEVRRREADETRYLPTLGR